MSSCDNASHCIQFLKNNSGAQVVYNEICEMGSVLATDALTGDLVPIRAGDLCTIGTACVDFSLLKCSRDNFTSCIKQGWSESGKTFYFFICHLYRYKPVLGFLENVLWLLFAGNDFPTCTKYKCLRSFVCIRQASFARMLFFTHCLIAPTLGWPTADRGQVRRDRSLS